MQGKGQLGMTMREWLRKQDAEASKTPAARAQEAAAQLTDGQAREGDVEAQHAGPATQTRQTGREARKLRSGKVTLTGGHQRLMAELSAPQPSIATCHDMQLADTHVACI